MCTRVFNNRNNQYLTTARNMDWKNQLPTSLFAFEKGLKKTGMPGDNKRALTWKSQYSSIVTMVGEEADGLAAADGINSMGLVANVLYDTGASYAINDSDHLSDKPNQLSVLRWLQYVLDNFVFAEEVVEALERQDITLVGAKVPNSGDSPATLHLSVSDMAGDSAIVEIRNGQFICYRNSTYRVMTNQPDFDTQLKLNEYWLYQWSDENVYPSHTIPGGPFSTDRFERTTFNINYLDRPDSMSESLAQVKSIAANASVPIGFNLKVENNPNISPTLWTSLANHNDKVYYFCNSRTTNIVWASLKEMVFSAPALKLDLVEIENGDYVNRTFDGQVNHLMTEAQDPYAR